LEDEIGGLKMTDDMNQSKRKPWTNDPDVVKQIWGENAQAALGTKTAVDRLVNQKGSLWPTDKELEAYGANALPDSQTFGRAPIAAAEDVVVQARHTPFLPPLVRKTDGMQDLVDGALGLKEAKSKKAMSKKQDIQLVDEGDEPEEDEDEDEGEPSPEAGRNPEEKAKKRKGKKTKEAAPYQEIFIPVTSIETRMKEARIRMQETINRNKR